MSRASDIAGAVERLPDDWELEQRVFYAYNDPELSSTHRSVLDELWRAYCALEAKLSSRPQPSGEGICPKCGASECWMSGCPKAQTSGEGLVELVVKTILSHRPDASFDDSAVGACERAALLSNVADEVRQALAAHQPSREGGES